MIWGVKVMAIGGCRNIANHRIFSTVRPGISLFCILYWKSICHTKIRVTNFAQLSINLQGTWTPLLSDYHIFIYRICPIYTFLYLSTYIVSLCGVAGGSVCGGGCSVGGGGGVVGGGGGAVAVAHGSAVPVRDDVRAEQGVSVQEDHRWNSNNGLTQLTWKIYCQQLHFRGVWCLRQKPRI